MYILAIGLLVTALASVQEPPDIELFLQAAHKDDREAQAALDQIARSWKNSYASMIVDMVRFMKPASRPPGTVSEDDREPHRLDPEEEEARSSVREQNPGADRPVQADPSTKIRERLIKFLEKQTGQKLGDDLNRWRQWMWKLKYEPHPDYAEFKGEVYATKDPRMSDLLSPGVESTIRLDEIDWSGVGVNGIPPLDHPKHIGASEATYLKDSNVVFGISINGESRAYPKRILGLHELAHDQIGGVEMTIVYCPLCGTVLPYESVVSGKPVVLGTSGLLYRSNKLMFDQETLSLWSTLEGKPVVGPLAGSDIELKLRSSVTTTWREWREQHPDTTVLSIDTGYKRDYSEGAANRAYFSTDRLLFQVPLANNRLKNKAEVLVMLLQAFGKKLPVAISTDFLRKNPVYQNRFGDASVVVVTTADGANRVFQPKDQRFTRKRTNDTIEDQSGRLWRVTEDALVAENNGAEKLPRITANRAFWFGWYAQFPSTELIK